MSAEEENEIEGLRAQVVALKRRLDQLTQQSAAEQEQLRASLDEKELLLREVHHRVKNNLQVITSLLSLQRRYAKSERDQAAFEDMHQRVSAMALVHEELHLGNGERLVDFKRYTKRLVNSLILIYAAGGVSHHFLLDSEEVWVDLDTAVTLGLMLNEAVSNAFKHAFPSGTSGDITVRIHQVEGGGLELVVSDSGFGFPDGFDPAQSQTLGLSLMSSLVQQLGGTLDVGNDVGARLELRLPARVVGRAPA